MSSSVRLSLNKRNKTFREGDVVEGSVVIETSHRSMQFQSIDVKVYGATKLQLSARTVGLFEAFYSSIEPMELMNLAIPLAQAGQVQQGRTEFPFTFKVKPFTGASRLYETYHGAYVNTSYEISVEVFRGMISSTLTDSTEFLIQVPSAKRYAVKPVAFSLTPESLENVKEESVQKIPRFNIEGKINELNCSITEPVTGEIVVKESKAAIESIELQLVRVETVIHEDGYGKEATEIQNIQLADGDVCRGMRIPVHIMFPRLFTCPTMLTNRFKVEFELNLTILFHECYMITENFPISIHRVH